MQMAWLLMASYGVCFGLMNDKVHILTRLAAWIPLWRDDSGHNFFQRMLFCAYCTGFHSGWVCWILHLLSSGEKFQFSSCFLFSLASSAFCYSLDVLLRRLEKSLD